MEKYAVIVAGGKGSRMNSEQPKQFMELDGQPILVQTLKTFLKVDGIKIIVVLPEDFIDYWTSIQDTYFPKETLKIVAGGISRTDSVKAGLSQIDEDGLVAIHDGARPFVSLETINASFESANKFGNGVAAVQLKDSIREKTNSESSQFRNRDNYVLVQTPQTFRISEIKKVYAQLEHSYSDDATAYEKAGYNVKLVEGEYSNIKITTPEDLK